MKEDICSIPIQDVFLPKTGCPICRMRDMLEDRMAVYITGAAMMEPDVREETNRLGFCHTHFDQMLAVGSRLSLALILESLLLETKRNIFADRKKMKQIRETAQKRVQSCFVCENIEKNMKHLIGSMFQLWQKEEEFRELYNEQEMLCLPHFTLLLEESVNLPKRNVEPFVLASSTLCERYLSRLCEDTTHFCRMFDYRNKGKDWGNSRDAIERAMTYLTARLPEAEQKADVKNR